MRKPLKRLKRAHLKFCELYASFVPPAVAYAQAFDRGEGPDEHPGNAARLLREPLVQDEIKRLMGEAESSADPTFIAYRRRLVRAELDRIAFFRLADVLDKDGNLRPLAELTDDQRAAVAEIAKGDDGKCRVKAHSKDAALAQLTKLDGLAEPDKIKVEGLDLSKLSDEQLTELRGILATALSAPVAA
jgi:hypothetical protein